MFLDGFLQRKASEGSLGAPLRLELHHARLNWLSKGLRSAARDGFHGEADDPPALPDLQEDPGGSGLATLHGGAFGARDAWGRGAQDHGLHPKSQGALDFDI